MVGMPAKEPPNRPSARRPDPEDPPVLSLQSREDTDVGWGDRPEADDDERLNSDRPPHWDSP
jgi:hypothetical protein